MLAQQHFKTLKARLEHTPYVVKLLSRSVSKAEIKQTLKLCASHGCDLVIGTHRLLSKDVVFSDLGFLVVDEEQRFGVKHKETLNMLKDTLDVLSVSATPIPRTMYMALNGSRDLSLIQTPPIHKKPVITQTLLFDEEKIKEVIEFEMNRDGAVFYIYNSVQSINKKARFIKSLVPNARIGMISPLIIKR